jgi:hypothetical protein
VGLATPPSLFQHRMHMKCESDPDIRIDWDRVPYAIQRISTISGEGRFKLAEVINLEEIESRIR